MRGLPILRGKDHPRWNGGRADSHPYVHVKAPAGHPRTGRRNGYVPEHILVAEKALGRFLDRRHPVHHVDENKKNNTPGNLVICESQAYHHLLHQRARAFAACGNPNARRCWKCKSYDRQDEITVFGSRSQNIIHRSCKAEVDRASRVRNGPRKRAVRKVVS